MLSPIRLVQDMRIRARKRRSSVGIEANSRSVISDGLRELSLGIVSVAAICIKRTPSADSDNGLRKAALYCAIATS